MGVAVAEITSKRAIGSAVVSSKALDNETAALQVYPVGIDGNPAGDASAANQSLQLTQATATNTNAGTTTDAAVTGDNDGTLSAKQRGLNKILADVWDSVNHWFKVSIQNATLAVTQSGTWTVQPGNTANTTAWKVDGSAVTQPVSIATNQPVGTIAHASADSGNPIKVGARAAATLSDDTMVANADRVDAVADLDGALLMRGQFPLGDLTSESVSDTGGSSTAFSNFGATSGVRNYITAATVFRTDAGTSTAYVDFRDGTGGAVIWRMPLPPNGGSIEPAGDVPYFKTSANTALAYDVSAALTTVYISVSGFRSKV
jgi:hypothetical protein